MMKLIKTLQTTLKSLFIGLLLCGCGSTDVKAARAFHTILGSDGMGFFVDEVRLKVHRDIRVSGLRIRHSSMANSICRSGRADFLELQGQIGSDSTEIVRRILTSLTPCIDPNDGSKQSIIVYLDSSGGLMSDGIALGRIFRQEGVALLLTIWTNLRFLMRNSS